MSNCYDVRDEMNMIQRESACDGFEDVRCESEAKVLRCISQRTGYSADSLQPELTLEELGLQMMDVVMLSQDLMDECKIEISVDELSDWATVRDAMQLVQRKQEYSQAADRG